jgi:hypothetical protein
MHVTLRMLLFYRNEIRMLHYFNKFYFASCETILIEGEIFFLFLQIKII